MSNEMPVNEIFVTLTDLKKEYRLSQKWIELLGPADKEKKNPHYRCAAPMKLYRKSRVDEFCKIHGEEYVKQRAKAEKRSRRSREVSDKKFEETLEYAQTVLIKLGSFPRNLRQTCFDHLEYRAFERGWYDYIPKVTERQVVNMLRHEYTNYHALLNSLFRRIGRWDAYPIIKDRVNRAICDRIGILFTIEISEDSDEEFLKKTWGESPEMFVR